MNKIVSGKYWVTTMNIIPAIDFFVAYCSENVNVVVTMNTAHA